MKTLFRLVKRLEVLDLPKWRRILIAWRMTQGVTMNQYLVISLICFLIAAGTIAWWIL